MKSEMSGSAQANMPQMTDQQKKDLQEKMNDPKMKEAMEKNPQLKAQMEAMMNSQNGGGLNSMMPSEMLVRIKGEKTLTKMTGGMMDGMEILYDGTAGKSYTIDQANKTYSEMSGGDMHANQGPDPTVTKTDETTTILGYTCTRYDVTYSEHGNSVTQHIWATKDIPGVDIKALAQQHMGSGPNFMEKIDGVPLKIEMSSPQMSMTMEATELKKEAQNAADFTIPSDFKQTAMGMGMMGQ